MAKSSTQYTTCRLRMCLPNATNTTTIWTHHAMNERVLYIGPNIIVHILIYSLLFPQILPTYCTLNQDSGEFKAGPFIMSNSSVKSVKQRRRTSVYCILTLNTVFLASVFYKSIFFLGQVPVLCNVELSTLLHVQLFFWDLCRLYRLNFTRNRTWLFVSVLWISYNEDWFADVARDFPGVIYFISHAVLLFLNVEVIWCLDSIRITESHIATPSSSHWHLWMWHAAWLQSVNDRTRLCRTCMPFTACKSLVPHYVHTRILRSSNQSLTIVPMVTPPGHPGF